MPSVRQMKFSSRLLVLLLCLFTPSLRAEENVRQAGPESRLVSSSNFVTDWTKHDGTTFAGWVEDFDYENKLLILRGTDDKNYGFPTQDLNFQSKLQLLNAIRFWYEPAREHFSGERLRPLGFAMGALFAGSLVIMLLALWITAIVLTPSRGTSLPRAIRCVFFWILGTLLAGFVYAGITIAISRNLWANFYTGYLTWHSVLQITIFLLLFSSISALVYRIGMFRGLSLTVLWMLLSAGLILGALAGIESLKPHSLEFALDQYVLKPIGLL